MNRLISVTVLSTISVLAATATTIPYGNPGKIAPESVITAVASGPVMGYFVQGGRASQGGAMDLDYVRLFDVTTDTLSSLIFNNQTTLSGTEANFGNVHAGDKLVFELVNEWYHYTDATDSAYSHDRVNHGYVTPFAGGLFDVNTKRGVLASQITLPAGIYVGMEDLEQATHTDNNYNDDSFLFTNVAAATITPVTPLNPVAAEPGSLMLVGTALLASAGAIRRKLLRK